MTAGSEMVLYALAFLIWTLAFGILIWIAEQLADWVRVRKATNDLERELNDMERELEENWEGK